MKWISVKERLPEEGRWVLVFLSQKFKGYDNFSQIVTAYLKMKQEHNTDPIRYYFRGCLNGRWCCCCCAKEFFFGKDNNKGMEVDNEVTHWMPLPEEPKDNE